VKEYNHRRKRQVHNLVYLYPSEILLAKIEMKDNRLFFFVLNKPALNCYAIDWHSFHMPERIHFSELVQSLQQWQLIN